MANEHLGNSFIINSLTERIKILEENLPKRKKRNLTTRAQQMLLLKHSCLLEKILEFHTPYKKDKILFLSILLNSDFSNLKDDLNTILLDDAGVATDENYEFVIDTFSKCNLQKEKQDAENIFKKLKNKRVTP
jgi:hypothetical protein